MSTNHLIKPSSRCAQALLVMLGMSLFLMLSSVEAAERYLLEFNANDDAAELSLSVGKSQIITSRAPLDQVVIGNPDIADIKILSSTQVLILGIKPGHTNLVFRDKRNSQVAVTDVVVGYDIEQVKKKVWEMMPDEEGIEIRASNNKMILAGQISSLMKMEQALSVAKSYVSEENITNLMQVGGGHQVMLEVRIAEISKRSLRDLGIESTFSDAGSSVLTGATGIASTNSPYLNVSNTWLQRFGMDSVELTLKALERRGLARVLAEPNLTALSGQEASFLAGGEVAIPVSQSGAIAGAITVEYKEFGIGLRFTPVVLNQDRINISLNAEVSAIDNSNSFKSSGFNIPGLITRRTGTTVEIGDGQAFAIAGLMEKDMNNVINEVPILGQIPVLGALFRSSEFQRRETELVVIVTPRLVAPAKAEDLYSPTDVVMPPNRLEQYLFGFLERKPAPDRNQQQATDSEQTEGAKSEYEGAVVDGLVGNYGHMVR